jgi:1-acyl-sn-glycerol-3-phosphate acyltransferase
MNIIRQIIGIATFACLGIVYLVGEIVFRVTLGVVRLVAPRKYESTLSFLVRAFRDASLGLPRLAGARFDIDFRVACEPGVLILMNHQSILDIPVCHAIVADGYPQMVAHHRYWRGIPLISQVMRVCRHIPVHPGRRETGREQLLLAARAADHPVVIFPEGHRTRDGEIRPWKRAGLEAFLSARPWTVYVVVVDGLWTSARITNFMRNIVRVRCRAEGVGPFAYDGSGRESHDEFINRLEAVMCAKLAEMRAGQHTETAQPNPSGSVMSS